jgi:hypothetical protein
MNMNSKYFLKYVKYKLKYLEYKHKMLGGTDGASPEDVVLDIDEDPPVKQLFNIFNLLFKSYRNDDTVPDNYISKITELSKKYDILKDIECTGQEDSGAFFQKILNLDLDNLLPKNIEIFEKLKQHLYLDEDTYVIYYTDPISIPIPVLDDNITQNINKIINTYLQYYEYNNTQINPNINPDKHKISNMIFVLQQLINDICNIYKGESIDLNHLKYLCQINNINNINCKIINSYPKIIDYIKNTFLDNMKISKTSITHSATQILTKKFELISNIDFIQSDPKIPIIYHKPEKILFDDMDDNAKQYAEINKIENNQLTIVTNNNFNDIIIINIQYVKTGDVREENITEFSKIERKFKIEEYFMKDHKYDLKGAIFHHGDNNNFGHYTTLLKNNGDNWVGISDSIVLNNLDIYMPFFNKNGKSVKNYRPKLLFYYKEGSNLYNEIEPKGIVNSGENCWYNSLMQNLIRMKPFTDLVEYFETHSEE